MKYSFKKILLQTIVSAAFLFSMIHHTVFAQGVPKLHIQLSDNKQIGTITKETKLFASMTIENANGSNFASENLYHGQIRIKGRGNSSWNATDKKSYSIDLINDAGKKNEVPLLGLPKNEDWILNAFYFDKTLLKNYFAYDLSNALGHWASHGWFVELYINDEYRGLYSLCENIKKGKQRVNVGDEGFIFEQDYPQRLEREDAKFFTSSRIYEGRYYNDSKPEDDYLYFGFKYPKDDDLTSEQLKEISDYVAAFETALYGSNFKDPGEGYRKYVDVNSFVDWYIMVELGGDWDHGYFLSSVYLNKPQGEKMKIGPVWDFDLAYKTNLNALRAREYAPWIKRMWEDESFRDLVFKRFVAAWPLVEASLTRVEEVAAELNKYGAIDRNFEKWDIIGTEIMFDDPPILETYDGELRKFIQWVRQRYMFIATYSNSNYCDILKLMKPAIRVIDQDAFDKGELSFEVESSSFRDIGKTPFYIWDGIKRESRKYTINSYGQHSVMISVGTCESLPSDFLLVKRLANIIVSENEQVYDGTPKSISVTTDPPSLAVQVTYNGSADPPVELGTYRVVAEINDAGYKGKQVSTLAIKSEITGVPGMEEIPLKIYPNPAYDILFVEGLDALLSKGSATVELTDMTGRLHIKKQISDMKVSLDVSALPNGLYLLRVISANRVIVRKLVID